MSKQRPMAKPTGCVIVYCFHNISKHRTNRELGSYRLWFANSLTTERFHYRTRFILCSGDTYHHARRIFLEEQRLC